MKRSVIALLALAVAGVAEAVPVPRRVVVYMTAIPGSDLRAAELEDLYESLIARILERAPTVAIVEGSTIGASPQAAAERTREARRQGGDAWLWVAVGRADGDYTARAQAFDIIAGGDVKIPSGQGLTDARWDPIIAGIKEAFQPVEPRAATTTTTVVRVRAAAGTRISGLPGRDIEVGSEGEASVELPAFAAYTITAVHPLRESTSRSFYLKDTPLLIECVQGRLRRWSLELALVKLAYPSAAIQWYALANRLRLGVEATTFNTGVPLWGDEGDTLVPLNEIGASATWYAGRPDWNVRPYAGVEAFIRLSRLELEQVAPFGFGLAAGLELAGTRRLRPFFEYNPQAYVLKDSDQVREYYEIREAYFKDTPYTLTGPLLWDFSSFEVGARIRF